MSSWKTHPTVSDIRHEIANVHTIVSDVHHYTSNTANIVDNIGHDASDTHHIVSGVRGDIVNTRVATSDIHRDKLKSRGGACGQNQVVGVTHTPTIIEQPFTTTRTYTRSVVSTTIESSV